MLALADFLGGEVKKTSTKQPKMEASSTLGSFVLYSKHQSLWFLMYLRVAECKVQ